ncbi:RNA polymerase sigma-70 factor [Flavihumibacter cheonanensis]|uniref:RNA polymerase sigma factor n=1 Tax=Flavihumibacter cheonanensis TaxID=1442385 RepID=UPI001EF862D9|nr:RNA polymerase sigma-70 factor [Flavihumibacter cheonanensis]MCG7753474.1 RNA polymerase sigma-70 factor [Flavihumibacter cheonanensis]
MQEDLQYDHWISFQKGEERGFTFFFKAYYPSFCQFANHLINEPAESESLVSEAFLAVFKHRAKLGSPAELKRYCYKAIRNSCLQWLKEKQKRENLHQEWSYTSESTEDHVLNAMIRSELFESLHQLIESLPPQCSKILSKLYIEGQSVKEIAEELNLSVSTVKNQKKIGLDYLKKSFQTNLFMSVLVFFMRYVII